MTTFFEPRKPRHWLRRALAVGAALAVLALIGLLLKHLLGESDGKRRRVVHDIALLRPPPPPPPPPPQEKPPEVKKEEVKIREPEKAPDPKQSDEAPAGDKLGLDAEGDAGSDAFGLAARKGGRDLLAGTGGGGSRLQFAFYTNFIQQHVSEELRKNKQLQTGDYRAIVRIWIAHDGRIERFELTGSSGNPDIDERLKAAFAQMAALKEPPPENMPQPVRMRITARGAG
jgi:protein TonB